MNFLSKVTGAALMVTVLAYAADAKYADGFKLGVGFDASIDRYKAKVTNTESATTQSDNNENKESGDKAQTNSSTTKDTSSDTTTTKKTKTGFGASILLGYDALVSDSIVLGVDASFGGNFGGKAKIYEKDSTTKYSDIKKQFNGEIAANVGFVVCDDLCLSLRAGGNITRYKINDYKDNTNNGSKNTTKFSPIVGVRATYSMTPNWSVFAGYTFQFNKTIAKKDEGKLSASAHKIGVGVLYTF